MRYGLYVHQFVEDPGNGDDSFGRLRPGGTIECSEDGRKLKQHLENRKVIEELSKEYRMCWHHDLLWACRRLSGSDPLDNFDFMITHVPPNDYSRKIFSDERMNYKDSLDRLETIKKVRPNMVLIAYTGAPREIREIISKEMGIFLLHRGRFGSDIEIEELKNMIHGKASLDSAW